MHTRNVFNIFITKKNNDIALRHAISIIIEDGVVIVLCESITDGKLHLRKHTTMLETVLRIDVDNIPIYKCDY